MLVCYMTLQISSKWPLECTNCSLQVKKGDFVYDPFVGTGSILVAASHYGAHTFGADIDIRIVRDGKPPNSLP